MLTIFDQEQQSLYLIKLLLKELISLVMADPWEFFKQHLIQNEEQPSFLKGYSTHFGKVSIM